MPSPSDSIRYELDADPGARLRHPEAIVALGGWVDAGSAATGAIRFLINALGARKLATLDPEEFYSFTDTRPLSTITGPGERGVTWPTAEFYTAVLPEAASSDVVLFLAPEPNLRWRSFGEAILDVLERAGVQRVWSIGSVFGAVHHRAEVRLNGWATAPELRDALSRNDVSFTRYEGPTGFVTVLLNIAQTRNVPSASVFGFTPNYIQGVPNPRVSYALLRTVAKLSGLTLPLTELGRAGRVLSVQVDKLLGDQPELREQVERMLRLVNAAEPPPIGEEEAAEQAREAEAAGENVELPSPQAVVKELEDFLKQLQRPNPNDDEDRGPGPPDPHP